ncbi:Intramolecular chaperone auto-processing domain containing protein [uncultured Caudovirales phage]|uniref:Intramolecular chaperone auto-processing domain containing protein n=1 Tax=uncultured Caudovirales phage TaxID=2100421 RepID=A0A6J7XA79_9CAUD|nr:Intramolecular chaperone auto-processing domain containing protein [uncultured Caudovirales phage]
MATLQGKAVKNTYRQVLQIGANNVGVSGTLQPVQDGAGINTALSLSTTAATINGTLTITGDLIITGGGIQITDLIDDTVATLIQNGTGITWAYNDTLRTLTPTITIATADGGVQGDFMQLNTGANEANAVAKIYWNSSEGTADLGLLGGQVILPLGQKQVARVLNNSGSIFNKSAYQVVKITAAQGQRLAVGLAQANNDANSTDTLGLVAENIANNQEGFITTSGLITNVDTTGDLQLEDWNDGDILYLSPTTPGAITKVKPIAPQHTIIVGFVVYAHKNNGKIYVKVDNGYELDELHNVRITAVADNNILQYNSALAVWENVAGTTTNLAEGTNLYYTQARFDSAFAAKTTTNLAEGTNLYFTTARGDANFATNFATKTTTNLPEGTNLYFTNSRARLALSVTAGTGISYNDGTGVFSLASIPNASLTNSSVTINSQALPLGGSVTLTTTNIAEGTNLYWTDARFDSRFGTKTTTNLAEGTNLYYTQARFNTAFDAKTTTDLDEGTNLYYTDARSRAAFSENAVGLDYSSGSGVLSLTSGYAIPTTVKLGQYDTAYNRSIVSAAVTGTGTKTLSLTQQDANVVTASWTDLGITTINGTANQIAATTVGNTTTLAFTNDVTMPNNLVVSGNLTINGTATYVNTQSISAKDPLFEVANDNNTTDAVDIGYYGRYFDSAQTRVEFTGLFRDASDAGKFKMFTGLVDEPTNVVDTTGTGYTIGTLVANFEGNLAGTANAANQLSTARSISATGDAAWTVNFDGSANATAALTLANTGVTATTYGTTTSVPTIAVDAKGRITSASNTNIAFPVTTVNGASGTVVLTTSNIAEGSNQYFTSARAQASITGGASSVVTADLTASRALVSDGSGKIAASASTTATEVSYLSGVTSAIQTQLNTKAADNAVVHLSGTETITGSKTFSGGLASNALTLTGALSGTSATFSGQVNSATKYAWGSSTTGTTGQIATDGTNNFFDYLGTLFIRNASASANRLILTSTGNLTIGSTEGTGAGTLFAGAATLTGALTGTSATFSSTVTGRSYSIVSPNGYSGQIISQGDIFGGAGTNLLFQSSTGNSIGFLTNGGTTFNMFINTSGNVLIGTTTDVGNKVYIVTPTASNGLRIVADPTYNALSIGGTGRLAADYPGVTNGRFELNDAGTLFLRQYGNGTVSIVAGQVISTSNINLKNDDGGIEDALNKVLKLNPRYFYWKEDSGIDSNERQLGFYAQEVQEALGEEVANDNGNGKWGVNDRGIIAMLTKAMQEQQVQIEELKALIAAK